MSLAAGVLLCARCADTAATLTQWRLAFGTQFVHVTSAEDQRVIRGALFGHAYGHHDRGGTRRMLLWVGQQF